MGVLLLLVHGNGAGQSVYYHYPYPYGVGTSFMIWSAYLKLTRKMGNAKEQGRMFSTSEFVRGIFGTLIGFVGVGLLGKAVLPSGELDPRLVGQQWRCC